MAFRHVRQVVSGFEGEIFKQRGGHLLFSIWQKTAVGYRKAPFFALTKTALNTK
ncbi:6-pyruvoyl tetrahydrobiopterin synthase [Klebsiella michiganensis]|nr:6-pyruvoyl tetrahydrobiopterin synthase [Klebsiella sp. M5al]AWT21851.1 6-pyruvoyl tetrahydrobiopterin synthase [Klebsiella michiganensis]MBW6008680.1 6-pyruvoyl tetrahydrobiopterin synthase [Klebsiella sp. CVUAS 11263]MBW6030508.1 6-pyruvoyl tetrahydrobiopterin synthase [Klebsiella sp. CVUAS 11332]MBX4671055.1 6-pyruvoyl tetrahydrobiopterin synthase [Klebsiella sp. CVUAS 5466.2]MBX4741327.1 6-pyruvoyl tetrahydrobiopterin synthase [Klebsiella sp. CVUAS 10975.2]MBX4755136.1 6-pyruvoyl tetra